MAENEGLDLSKVVSLIMENPKLIEEISALAKSEKGKNDETDTPPTLVTEEPTVEIAKVDDTYKAARGGKSRRNELLCAMKPYLSQERAKAVDSMLTIVEILDLMRER